MRKLLTFALALVLALASVLPCALAEQPGYLSYDYTPSLITQIDLSAEEWVSSAEYRAMATLLVAYDMMATLGADSERTPNIVRTSYVGRNGDDVMLYLRAESQDLLVRYTPKDGTGDYAAFMPLNDDDASTAMQKICPNGSYVNDLLTIVALVEQLRDRVEQAGAE